MATEKRLIYLDEAKKLFDDIPPYIGMTGKCVQGMLDDAPTVDAVEVVHGRWYYDGVVSVNAHCWICGEQVPVWMMKYSYCPNCGARMDGGADSGL